MTKISMTKIFLISDRINIIEKYDRLCRENSYDFNSSADANIITDILSAETQDIVLVDNEIKAFSVKEILKNIRNLVENSIVILVTGKETPDKDISKSINALISDDFSDSMILSALSINIRAQNSLKKLADTNKDLAASLYRQNTLYGISSQFASTLNSEKLLEFMIEGLDKTLSFSLACTLSFCSGDEPLLILNSLYEISDELLNAIKVRTIYNYNSLFENGQVPFKIDENKLKVIKYVKYPASRFNFTLFRFDNMFARIALGDTFYGCVEVFKENHFSPEDSKCFQTIVQQVTLPLKNASLYQEIIETNKKLERLEKLKSEFISIVSHELRTPLTSIKNSLDILLSGRCGEVTENSEKFLSMRENGFSIQTGFC